MATRIAKSSRRRLAPLTLADSMKVRLGRLYPKSVVKAPIDTVLVPLELPPGPPILQVPQPDHAVVGTGCGKSAIGADGCGQQRGSLD